MAVSTFATSDEPVDPVDVESYERAEQGLRTDEAHGRGYLPQVIGTIDEPPILD